MKDLSCQAVCIREIRKRRADEFRRRLRPLEDRIGAGMKPMLTNMVRGRADSGEMARKLLEMLEKQKAEYAVKRRRAMIEVLGEFAKEIDARMGAPAREIDGFGKAEIIFSEREFYGEGEVEAAQVALLEKFSEINPESTCLSGRDLVLLSVLQNERRASVETEVASCRQFIVNELNDLNVPVSEELISELEAALAAKGLDFMKKPVAAKIEILETVIRLSRATETETAAPAAQNPESTGMEGEPQEMPAAPPALAPARVSAYGEKGFQINASHVRAIMDSEGISEKKARAYMGAIVYGYKLGSSKPAIGNVYFNTNAVQKNLRAVAEIAELGLRPLNVIKFLAKRGVVSVRKSGDTSSLNFHTADMEEPWKALMVEIFRQHQRITGNGN